MRPIESAPDTRATLAGTLQPIRSRGMMRLLVLLWAPALLAACARPTAEGPAPVTSGEPDQAAATTSVRDMPAPGELEAELRALVDGFRGEIGIYARRLESGAGSPGIWTAGAGWDRSGGAAVGDATATGEMATAEAVAIAADEIYPTASMVKVPLLIGLMEKVEAGEVALDDRLVYDDSLFYPSEGDVINKLRPGETISLETLAVQMIVRSDNTASLWIQGLVGGATVNEWLAARGFDHTRVNSRVEGRRGDWEVYGWGQSTPREMARLLTMIRNGEVVSDEASKWMYRLLSRAWWPDGATSQIPARVNVASKPGAVSAARSEVMVVNAPAGDYVLCIMTREQEDTSWAYENEGEALIRAVSRAVWEAWGYREPGN